MANVHNSFDILLGNEEKEQPVRNQSETASNSSRKKKNRKSKKLDSVTPINEKEELDADLPKSGSKNAEKAEIESKSIAAGKILLPSQVNPHPPSSLESNSPIAAEISTLESAASVFSGNSNRRLQKWYEWIARGQTAYPEPQFGMQSWKWVFLQSEALEITISSCLQPPLEMADKPHLQNLLATFLPGHDAQALCQVLFDLSQGINALGPQEPSLLLSAKQAVRYSVTALKQGDTNWAMDELTAKLTDLSITQQLNDLAKKASEADLQHSHIQESPQESASLPERARLSEQWMSLTEARLNLLMPEVQEPPVDGSPDTDNSSPASRALHHVRQLAARMRDWKSLSVNAGHVLEPERPAGEGQSEGQGQKVSRESQEVEQALLQVNQEAEDVRKQLDSAEKEVERLRALSAQLEARRSSLQARRQQEQAKAESGAESAAPTAVVSPLPAPSLQQWSSHQLGVVHALEAILLRPSYNLESFGGVGSLGYGAVQAVTVQEEAVGAVVSRAVMDHLHALEAFVNSKHSQMLAAGERLQFSRDKSSTLESELNKLSKLRKDKLAKALLKPRETYQGMTKEWLRAVQSLNAAAQGVEQSLQSPGFRTAVALLPPNQSMHNMLNQISLKLTQVGIDYRNIVEGLFEPRAVSSNGDSNGAGAGNGAPVSSSGQYEGEAEARHHSGQPHWQVGRMSN